MTLDVQHISAVAGGEPFVPAPISVIGGEVTPPATPSTQATGTGATSLRARYSGGKVKIFGKVKNFAGAEAVVKSGAAQLFAAGSAQWFTLVAVAHRVTGLISLVWVAGDAAVVASAVVPTMDEIQETLGDNNRFCVLGDIRFYRSADTVIQSKTDNSRRPDYVDSDEKTALVKDSHAPSTAGQELKFWGYMDIPLGLLAAYGKGAGNLYADGVQLPKFPYGGRITAWEYIASVAPAGAGADITLRMGLDGTPYAASDMQLLLATTAVGAAPPRIDSLALDFTPGATFDIEVEAAATAYTAGVGSLRVEIYEYV